MMMMADTRSAYEKKWQAEQEIEEAKRRAGEGADIIPVELDPPPRDGMSHQCFDGRAEISHTIDNADAEAESPTPKLPDEHTRDVIFALKERWKQQVRLVLGTGYPEPFLGQFDANACLERWDASLLAEIVDAKDVGVAKQIIAYRGDYKPGSCDGLKGVEELRAKAELRADVQAEIVKDRLLEAGNKFDVFPSPAHQHCAPSIPATYPYAINT
jgi:hypothetical protein